MGPPRGATCICPHYLDIKWLFFQYNGPSSKSHRSKGRPSLLPVTMTMGHWEIQEASNTQCTPTSSLSALGNTKSLERTRGPRKGVSTLSELDTHLLCSSTRDWESRPLKKMPCKQGVCLLYPVVVVVYHVTPGIILWVLQAMAQKCFQNLYSVIK